MNPIQPTSTAITVPTQPIKKPTTYMPEGVIKDPAALIKLTEEGLQSVIKEISVTIENIPQPDIGQYRTHTEEKGYSTLIHKTNGTYFINDQNKYAIDREKIRAVEALNKQKIAIVEGHNGLPFIVLGGPSLGHYYLRRVREVIHAPLVQIPSLDEIGQRLLGKVLL